LKDYKTNRIEDKVGRILAKTTNDILKTLKKQHRLFFNAQMLQLISLEKEEWTRRISGDYDSYVTA
jgi:hypothetical protein